VEELIHRIDPELKSALLRALLRDNAGEGKVLPAGRTQTHKVELENLHGNYPVALTFTWTRKDFRVSTAGSINGALNKQELTQFIDLLMEARDQMEDQDQVED